MKTYVFDGPKMAPGGSVYLSDPALGGERVCWHPKRPATPQEIKHHNPLNEIPGDVAEKLGPEAAWQLENLIEREVVRVVDVKPAKPAKE